MEGGVPFHILLDDHLASVQRLGPDVWSLLRAGPEHDLLRHHGPVLGHPDHVTEPFLRIEVAHGDVLASLRCLLYGDDAVQGKVYHLRLSLPAPENEPAVAELLEDISGKDEGTCLRISETPVAEQDRALPGYGFIQGHQVVQSHQGVVLLAFLPMQSEEAHQYWNEMNYCVEFALCNRRLMMERICATIGEVYPDARFEPMINIAHNYAVWEHHFDENVIVHRKGATRACEGEVGIIPDSFQSCSHGAGRAMSRTEAVRKLSLEAEVSRLEELGIVHAIRGQKDLEEAAGAYKDIDEVMANQKDLVKIVTALSPVAVIKG